MQITGKWTGIITTDSLTGGTPSAGYASTPERNWATDDGTDMGGCKDIAAQLVDDNDFIRVKIEFDINMYIMFRYLKILKSISIKC